MRARIAARQRGRRGMAGAVKLTHLHFKSMYDLILLIMILNPEVRDDDKYIELQVD